jgi:hypothetical protein
MKSRANLKRAVAAVAVGVIIGGGVTIVSPAGAEVSQFAATNWKKIWKKKLQPLADKRYYKKSASDAKYSTKAETGAAFANYYTKAQTDAALAGYYTKAQADAKYQPVGNYAAAGSSYTKADSDAKYAPAQALYRGTYMIMDNSSVAGGVSANGISFGATFPSAPTPHYIKVGDAIPADCSGTAAAPNAAPGHLCVFETEAFNAAANRGVCRGGPAQCAVADPFGAGIYSFATNAGLLEILGTWAARPSGPVVNPTFAPADKGAVNAGKSGGELASTR